MGATGIVHTTPAVAGVSGPPGAATLISPSGSGHTNPVDFTWQAVADSTWYYLWVNKGLTGSTNAHKKWYTAEQAGCAGGGTCTISAPVNLLHGDYRWWIQTWNPAGHGPWSEATMFSVPQVSQATNLTAPQGSLHNPIDFTWESVDGSTWYYLWINKGTSGSTNAFKRWYTAEQAGCAGGGTCTISAPANFTAGAHRWWIQTWNLEGHGPWSDPVHFTVLLPGQAALISPSNATPNPVTFEWGAVEGATFYYLWVNEGSTNVVKQWFTSEQAGCASGTGTCSVVSPAELSSAAHSWWIRTWSPAGYGPWSDRTDFSVATDADLVASAEILAVSAGEFYITPTIKNLGPLPVSATDLTFTITQGSGAASVDPFFPMGTYSGSGPCVAFGSAGSPGSWGGTCTDVVMDPGENLFTVFHIVYNVTPSISATSEGFDRVVADPNLSNNVATDSFFP